MRKTILTLTTLAFLLNFNACSCDNKKGVKETNITRERKEHRKLSPTEIANRLRVATVIIKGRFVEDDPLFDDEERWLGSGFFIKNDGDTYYILTNLHVIGFDYMLESDKTAPEIKEYTLVVRDCDDRRLPIKQVLFHERLADLAIIVVDSKGKNYQVLPLRKDLPEAGEKVYAMGHPHGIQYNLTHGLVSSVEKIDGLPCIVTDAPINPGNSGGPLVDEYGKAVGINTSKLRNAEGIAFAISSNAILDAWERGSFIPFPFDNPTKISDLLKEYKSGE